MQPYYYYMFQQKSERQRKKSRPRRSLAFTLSMTKLALKKPKLIYEVHWGNDDFPFESLFPVDTDVITNVLTFCRMLLSFQ